MNWKRVSKAEKCPICGHDSWCICTQDVVICMRVESDKPKTFKTGEVGWLHRITGQSHPTTTTDHKEPSKLTPAIDWRKMIGEWDERTHHEQLHNFAKHLGVSYGALCALECSNAWDHGAWAFAMKDGYENVVGVRLRDYVGNKWAVRGSHQGIFIPLVKPDRQITLVVEGPTDTAAALDLGFYAIGRPSCSGGGPQIKSFLYRKGIKRVVIISDNDEFGVRGAETLCELLPLPCCIILLPCKDLRDYVRFGGDRKLLDSKIDSAIWHNT